MASEGSRPKKDTQDGIEPVRGVDRPVLSVVPARKPPGAVVARISLAPAPAGAPPQQRPSDTVLGVGPPEIRGWTSIPAPARLTGAEPIIPEDFASSIVEPIPTGASSMGLAAASMDDGLDAWSEEENADTVVARLRFRPTKKLLLIAGGGVLVLAAGALALFFVLGGQKKAPSKNAGAQRGAAKKVVVEAGAAGPTTAAKAKAPAPKAQAAADTKVAEANKRVPDSVTAAKKPEKAADPKPVAKNAAKSAPAIEPSKPASRQTTAAMRDEARSLRSGGKRAFKRGEYAKAAKRFTGALALLPDDARLCRRRRASTS